MSDIYEIHVKGRLDSHWAHWFDDMAMQYQEDGTTVLVGAVADQSALHGILERIRDLGLPLLKVKHRETRN